MIKWIKIFQIQKIDEKILEKRKRFKEFNSQKDLYEEFIELFKEIKKEFLELKFDKTPSVEVDKIPKNGDKKIIERAKLLSNVSLLEHTENVLKVVEEKVNFENINNYLTVKLMALLHDAGKSKLLRSKYNINDNISHEKASYLYAKKKLKGTSFEYIANLLLKDTYHLNFLSEVDKIARERELKRLNKDN